MSVADVDKQFHQLGKPCMEQHLALIQAQSVMPPVLAIEADPHLPVLP